MIEFTWEPFTCTDLRESCQLIVTDGERRIKVKGAYRDLPDGEWRVVARGDDGTYPTRDATIPAILRREIEEREREVALVQGRIALMREAIERL